eukprot:TRINITY_DN2230_c0_g1_i10.p1 TRINITY_DN2230_c0_g1~~TRINITY_DN2230_c0_g1_i10.p1  ORF type:complete len:533 (+),score=99.28 TRINITY_DN2230_c0_g1_i10:43-1641(+)
MSLFETADHRSSRSSWAADLFDVDMFLGRHGRDEIPSRLYLCFRFINSSMLFSSAYLSVGLFATALDAGANLGYELLWIVVFSSVMSFGFQLLATKLALVTEGNIMENSVDEHPVNVSFIIWVLLLVNIVSAQIVHLVGAAVGLGMITDLSISYSAILLSVDIIPYIFRGHARFSKLEILIGYGSLLIGIFIFGNAFTAHPSASDMALGFIPNFSQRSIYTAISFIGSTISAHALYFQSYVITTKNFDRVESKIKRMYLFNIFESLLAWLGYFVLAVICIVVSASYYSKDDEKPLLSVEDVAILLEGHYKEHASRVLMGFVLLLTGEATMSRLTLTSAVISKNIISRAPQPWVHHLLLRILSITPLIVIDSQWDSADVFLKMIILCQVISAFILPVALVQIVKTATSKTKMLSHAISWPVTILCYSVIFMLVFANVFMAYEETYFLTENLDRDLRNFLFFAIAICVVVYMLFLLYLLCYDVEWVVRYVFCQKYSRKTLHSAYAFRKDRPSSRTFLFHEEDEGAELLSRRGDL